MTQGQRFMPCSLIRHKTNGTYHIVDYDYSYAYGQWNQGCNFFDLSLYDLDKDGNIEQHWSWAHAEDYELVEEASRKWLNKISEYQQKHYGQAL